METWQVWLITLACLLLGSTFISVGVYLMLTLRAVRKTLIAFEEQLEDVKCVLDFFSGVKAARKQAQQSFEEKETRYSSWSYDLGRLVTDVALTGLTIWKTLHKRRKP